MAFLMSVLLKLLYHLADVAKCFVVQYILITLYRKQTFKISQTEKRYKYFMRKIYKNSTDKTRQTCGTDNS